MDKRLILAVAGSGKTYHLIEAMRAKKRILVVTYTTANLKNIRTRIIKEFGFIPGNITLYTFTSFLYSFCFKPFLSWETKCKGITYNRPSMYYSKPLSPNGWLYHNRISKIVQKNALQEVRERLENFYDLFMIDEFQDISANDFEFVLSLVPANINMLFVGDYFQHTFDTSTDGNKLSYLYKDYVRFEKLIRASGLLLDTETLSKSWRCSPTTCEYVRENLGIEIQSHNGETTNICIVSEVEESLAIFNNNEIVKLFEKKHYAFDCYSNNWGLSKGEDKYQDVCIILTDAASKLLAKGELFKSKQLNKLYVAFTRAKGNIYLIPSKLLKKAIKSQHV